MAKEIRSKIILIGLMGLAAVAVRLVRGPVFSFESLRSMLDYSPQLVPHYSGIGGGLLVIVSLLGLFGVLPYKGCGRLALIVSAVTGLGIIFPNISYVIGSGNLLNIAFFAIPVVPYFVAGKAGVELILFDGEK